MSTNNYYKMKKNKVWNENVKCGKCGYNNHIYWVKKSGICNGCGNILDSKAKFKKDMREKLHLVGGKRWTY